MDFVEILEVFAPASLILCVLLGLAMYLRNKDGGPPRRFLFSDRWLQRRITDDGADDLAQWLGCTDAKAFHRTVNGLFLPLDADGTQHRQVWLVFSKDRRAMLVYIKVSDWLYVMVCISSTQSLELAYRKLQRLVVCLTDNPDDQIVGYASLLSWLLKTDQSDPQSRSQGAAVYRMVS
jgi:hypothetical protein